MSLQHSQSLLVRLRAIDRVSDAFRRTGSLLPLRVVHHLGQGTFFTSSGLSDGENGMQKLVARYPNQVARTNMRGC